MAISKVVYGNRTLMDISADSVSAEKLLQNETAHDSKGNAIVGTLEAYTNEVLLWENPDPTASLASKVLLDGLSDDYKAFKIVWRQHVDQPAPAALGLTISDEYEESEMIVRRIDLIRIIIHACGIAEKNLYQLPARILLYGRSKNYNTSRAIDFWYLPEGSITTEYTGPCWTSIQAGQAKQAGTDTNSNKTAVPVAIYGLN